MEKKENINYDINILIYYCLEESKINIKEINFCVYSRNNNGINNNSINKKKILAKKTIIHF